MSWGRLFIFQETRANVLVYFSVLSIILMLGPEKIMPSLKQRSDAPVINAPAGDIGGDVMTTRKGRTIYAYKGIPYAEAPVDDLRFQKTKPLRTQLDGVWNGKNSFRKCVQPTGISFYPYIGDENCLFLNIYVSPTPESDEGKPVMVWFHGGGFVMGDSSDELYGPGYLLDKDVVLVTVNYRLGVLGFLNLGEEEVPGNQGLWDQLEALRWVQRNIHAFGGQRKKVTIFGESAGGFSISSHLASRKSKGYFSAAIVQSGPLELPAFRTQKPLQEMHQEFIERIGCQSSANKDEILNCLRDKPVSEFIAEMNMFDHCSTWPQGLVYPQIWAPDDDSSFMKDSFFAQNPLEIFTSGTFNKVPTMIGATKDEGFLYTATYPGDPNNFEKNYQKNWKKCAAMNFLGTYESSNVIDSKIDQIEEFYFKNGVSFDEAGLQNLSTALGDAGFLYGTDLLAKQLAKETKTYYYHYDHVGTYSAADFFGESIAGLVWKVFKMALGLEKGKQMGASHGDEVMYLLK